MITFMLLFKFLHLLIYQSIYIANMQHPSHISQTMPKIQDAVILKTKSAKSWNSNCMLQAIAGYTENTPYKGIAWTSALYQQQLRTHVNFKGNTSKVILKFKVFPFPRRQWGRRRLPTWGATVSVSGRSRLGGDNNRVPPPTCWNSDNG